MRSDLARPRPLLVAVVLAAMLAAACTAASGGTAGSSGSPSPALDLTKLEQAKAHLKHVVFVVQENRSFDHYFGTFPGADGIPMRNGKPTVCIPDPVLGRCVRPYHDATLKQEGGPHAFKQSVMDVNRGRMDGFVRAVVAGPNDCADTRLAVDCRHGTDLGPARQPDVMSWHDAREIPNYWRYAKRFVLQDH